MRIPAAEHLRAIAGGYSWLPCPLCGEHFGGHEWDHRFSIPDPKFPADANPQRMLGICTPCGVALGKQRRAICDTYGHRPVSCYPGEMESDNDLLVVAFDLGGMAEMTYCRRCWQMLEAF